MIDSFRGKYSFLSNFYTCTLDYEGIIYPSSEHAFQAAKTLDRQERLRISVARTAGYAKRMGRKVRLRPDWNDVRLQVMADVVWQKFLPGEMAGKLLMTIGEELVEGNTWGDRFWGVCDGVGENHLGIILMDTRQKLLESLYKEVNNEG